MIRTFRSSFVGLTLFALAACGGASNAPEKGVEVSGLYVIDPAGGRDVAGGGLEITAHGEAMRFVSAHSVGAERVELHVHQSEDGVMRMRQVDGFDIAKDETFSLKPGGAHLMFFGFDDTLGPGDRLEVSLVFERADGTQITLLESAEVRDLSQIGQGSQTGSGHGS